MFSTGTETRAALNHTNICTIYVGLNELNENLVCRLASHWVGKMRSSLLSLSTLRCRAREVYAPNRNARTSDS